jgi:RNA polymerase sigma-B factor
MSTTNGRALRARESGPSEEPELVALARGRDEWAMSELVARYTPLVRQAARRAHGRGAEDLEDLIQVGMLGLVESVDRFDPEKGSFAGFASVTISGTIKRHLRDRSWRLRLGRSLHDAIQQVGPAATALESSLGRPPTTAELAARTGLGADLVAEAQQALVAAHPASLEAPAAGDGVTTLGELIGDEDPDIARADARAMVRRGTAGLSAEDRELIARRFGLEQTQGEIAETMGGSQMRISRRLRTVLGEMGSTLGAEGDRRGGGAAAVGGSGRMRDLEP